jgi:hypothetical protein
VDAASRQQQEGIASARENIARLTEMSADLEQKVSGLLPAREAEAPRADEAPGAGFEDSVKLRASKNVKQPIRRAR